MMKIGNLEVYGIIYKIENLVNGKVYIGQTTQGFNKRYNRFGKNIERVYNFHKKCEKTNMRHNHHLLQSIEKYGFDNFKVDKIIDYAFSEYELDIKEKCWIQYYDSFYNGYNMTLGGDSAMKGENHLLSRKIIQLSLEGEYIKTWGCMIDVAKYFNINASNITKACKTRNSSCQGFVWVYEDEYDPNKNYKYIKKLGSNSRSVIQLDYDGNFINKYDNITIATQFNENFTVVGIYKCCKGIRKSYKNFIWLFEEDYDKSKDYKYNVKSEGKNKEVLVFDKDMNFIKEYKSISQASKDYEYCTSSIKNYLNHKHTEIKNHIFIYKEEYNKISR